MFGLWARYSYLQIFIPLLSSLMTQNQAGDHTTATLARLLLIEGVVVRGFKEELQLAPMPVQMNQMKIE